MYKKSNGIRFQYSVLGGTPVSVKLYITVLVPISSYTQNATDLDPWHFVCFLFCFIIRIESFHQNTVPFHIITLKFFLLHNTIAVT